jgi:hypothetical protein
MKKGRKIFISLPLNVMYLPIVIVAAVMIGQLFFYLLQLYKVIICISLLEYLPF